MGYYHHVRTFPGNLLISVDGWRTYQSTYTPRLDRLVLVTDEARDYYITHYGIDPEKVISVENYPDPASLLHNSGDESVTEKYRNRKMLLYFGDTGLRRGTGTVLEAARLLKDDPEYCFVIIGDSREQKILTGIANSQGLDNVELTGFLPLQKAAAYFRAAYAGLSPLLRNIHHDTTFANKVFQYMAFRLPVIASNCTAQERVVTESGCGLVHEAGDAADLVRRIRELDDGEVYDSMGRKAADAVKIKYNFTAAGSKLVEIYEQIEDEIKGDQQA